jgi:hypothetical protein
MPQRVTPAYIAQRARAHNLDPQAVLAVASHKKASGAVSATTARRSGRSSSTTAARTRRRRRTARGRRRRGRGHRPASSTRSRQRRRSPAGSTGRGRSGASSRGSNVRPIREARFRVRSPPTATGRHGGSAPMQRGRPPKAGRRIRHGPPRTTTSRSRSPCSARSGRRTPTTRGVPTAGAAGASGSRSRPADAVSRSPRAAETAPRAGGGPQISGQLAGLNPRFEHELEQAVGAAGGTKVRVDSGYRSPAHNAAVGGVPHSNHTTGDAADGAPTCPAKAGCLSALCSVAAPRGSGCAPATNQASTTAARDPVHVDDGRTKGGTMSEPFHEDRPGGIFIPFDKLLEQMDKKLDAIRDELRAIHDRSSTGRCSTLS